MTFMLDGKQYIAVMGGTGAGVRGRGAGPLQEPTTAAAQAASDTTQPLSITPALPIPTPKMFVYSVPD